MKNSILYNQDIESILCFDCNWMLLKNKTILIAGATGLIGTILTDMLLFLNKKYNLKLTLLLLSRTERKSDFPNLKFVKHDVNEPFNYDKRIDYIINAASNTHPLQYKQFPVETITTNIFGTYHLLSICKNNPASRFVFLSSVEVYGDDRQCLADGFSEEDFGYIDCNLARNGYNESKRLSESLCQSFKAQFNIDFVTARLARCYGPTIRKGDSKAINQFLCNALNGNDIVLKSKGEQYYSFLYSADAASAIIFLMLNGKDGEAYNIADKSSDITLFDLANLISKKSNNKNCQVVFDLPSEAELKGFSKANRAILNSKKICDLGWSAKFNIESGIERTLEMLRNENDSIVK